MRNPLAALPLLLSLALAGLLWVNHSQAAGQPVLLTALLPTMYDWSYPGVDDGDRFGTSVHTAGDVNGDGYADIIVGAPKFTYQVYKEGTAFVFHGGESGLAVEPGWIMGGGLQGISFGTAVSSAGDVNGDGWDDVIVGAPDYQVDFGLSGTPPSGAVFVYHGSDDGLSAAFNWKVEAEAPRIRLGDAVSAAGDVNGDGWDDVIVSAPHYESEESQTNEGKVYLYLGSAGGLSTTPAWTYECDQYYALCGTSLDAAGDVNHDSHADIIIGAPRCSNLVAGSGCALVFYGRDTAAGLSLTPDWAMEGPHDGATFGTAVAGAGDVNGDTFDDILVGAPGTTMDEQVLQPGAAYLYYGSTDGPNLAPDWVTYGTEATARYGAALHRGGDVDRDGYSDILVGAYLMGTSSDLQRKPDEGAAYLFTGSPTGLGSTPAWSAYGDKAEAWFGFSLGTAGDVNGDGYDDALVGAPNFRYDEKTVMGKAFAYYHKFNIYLPLTLRRPAE